MRKIELDWKTADPLLGVISDRKIATIVQGYSRAYPQTGDGIVEKRAK